MGSLDRLLIDRPSLGILVIDGSSLESPLLSSKLSESPIIATSHYPPVTSQPPVTIYQSPVQPSTTVRGSLRSKLEDEEHRPTRRHKQFLKTKNLSKRIALLENEHSKYFARWLRKEVERELAISKYSVSEAVRWISYGSRATIVKSKAYNISGYTFRTKSNDGIIYQNSRVTVEAVDFTYPKKLQPQEKHFIMGFYKRYGY
uniref:Uncharacterized protein n=1 Tax=Tanacetum cinerariifolium TaxID=118510 RepID=A0A699HD21_TANCI|nr:hypothetical protein [Tanacetum cinerariifolium]